MTPTTKKFAVGTLSYTVPGLILLFFWLLAGDFAWSMKERGVNSTATLMIRNFGVSDFLYSIIIISIPSFTNIFLGPIVSYISDRHRGKLGRRIPFLIFTTPFIVCGLTGLAFTPYLGQKLFELTSGNWLSLNAISLIFFGLFWIMLDFGTTLANVIFVALVNDVVPKDLLGRFFGLFRAVSLGAGILFNYYLLDLAKVYGIYIFGGLAIIYGIGFTLMCFKVKEGEYPPEDRPTQYGLKSFWGATRSYFHDCFAQPYYRWVIIAWAASNLVGLPLNAYTIFYAESMNISMALLGKYLAITYIISFVLSYPLGAIADRFHPIASSLIGVILYLIFSILGLFLIQGTSSFAIMFVLHGVLAGTIGTLGASYGQKLFPQAIFAQFNSAMLGVLFIGYTVIAPITGKFLDLTGNKYHYVFYVAIAISVLGIVALIKVQKYFVRYGGLKNYQAPDYR